MKNKIRLLVMVICLFITTNLLQAQWIKTNLPSSGYELGTFIIRTLAVIDTNLFAATSGHGIFLTADNGASWTSASTGLTNTNVHALAVSGTNLFAGTYGGGVFLSTDYGASWSAVNTGLMDTIVRTFAVSGANLFAGTHSGVFLSTNNGASWTAVSTGLTALRVSSLAVSGTNLFAGTYDGGVFLSTDNGTSWTAVNASLTNNNVHALAISGANVFAGTWMGGVFRSSNNGASWAEVNNGLTSRSVDALASSGTNLFVGTQGGPFVSTNSGRSWTQVKTGMDQEPGWEFVTSFAVYDTNLFAGTYRWGVWRRPLLQVTIPNDPPILISASIDTAYEDSLFTYTAKAIDPNNDKIEYFFKNYPRWLTPSDSTISGIPRVREQNTSFTLIATAKNASDTLLVQIIVSPVKGPLQIIRLTDFSFENMNTYIIDLDTCVIYDEYSPESLIWQITASDSHLKVSLTNHIINFSAPNRAGTTAVNFIVTDPEGASDSIRINITVQLPVVLHDQWIKTNFPSKKDIVYSLAVIDTNLFAGTSEHGIFLTTDKGESWTAVNAGLMNTNVRALAISGTNLFAGTYGGGVFLSTDNGTSWSAVNTGLTNPDVNALAVSGTNLIAGTNGSGVFLSTDNGTSWTAASTGLTTDANVRAFLVSGTNLFAGTYDGGVFLSTDNGASWTAASTGVSGTDVRAFAAYGTHLFVGLLFGGVFLSTNNGTSWTDINNGLRFNMVFSLAVSDTNLFAGILESIFLTTNNGASWSEVRTGMGWFTVASFAIYGTDIFAGMYGEGVWRRPLSEMIFPPVSVEGGSTDLPTHFNLGQNYPNPFNPTTIIPFSLAAKSFVSLKIFNVLGKEVSILLAKELPAGTYAQQWNALALPAGLYFCHLQAGSFSATKKLVLLK